ncbi:MAG: methyltransferase domain-containing protein [Patescibacteria group bacterium]|nr:methyltransferase domain-containing protein [Patescibacteria group bacterium]
MNQENNKNHNDQWWSEDYGFFGDFYIEGDNSDEGYLINKKQGLEERTKEEVDGIIKLLSLKNNSKVLDCPCGYGRHSIELARRGIIVTGSDINSIHLGKAEEEAERQGLKVNFVKENMLKLKYNSEFDAVINMFYSFGFFETDEENKEVLKNFYNALAPGGKFLMHTDVNVPTITSGQYKQDEERTLRNGNVLRIIDKYDPKTKRINGTWIIKNQSGEEEKKDYSVRVYTKEEFIDLCYKIGFKECCTYSDWSGEEYTASSEDMIIVATK